jgi:GTP-binding protein
MPGPESRFPILKVLSADFVTSAAAGGRTDGIPADGLAQVALAGRSNVGKSTLLNALARQKLARTSAAPGKTRLANIFRLTLDGGPGGPGRWGLYLVDLPGYGYARGGDDSAKELAAVAAAYFASGRGSGLGTRPPPPVAQAGPAASSGGPPERSNRATLLLIDSRHPGLESDVQAHRWLSTVGAMPLVVATKVDKLSRAERVRNLEQLERVLGSAPLPVSATGGEGLDELWRLIAKVARSRDK